jgi:rubrerythrin
MARLFARNIENFTCGRCGAVVEGNGFTNHCPSCLFSKHVDENPGDRAAGCGGAMEPIAVEQARGRYVIVHRCLKCGRVKRNKSSPADSSVALVEVARRRAMS